MANNTQQNSRAVSDIDFDFLMDLRIDYAFKLFFTKGSPLLLISLINAIFANKKIKRVIKSLTIVNPFLDKMSEDDKLSVLDIIAVLDDGTHVLIEMHLYGLYELKYKTIRALARVYGEDLSKGGNYAEQPSAVVIAFTDGQVRPLEKEGAKSPDKIHRLCMLADAEDFTVFSDAMELHYIDMKAFARAVNEKGSINIDGTVEPLFAAWLSLITQKEIEDKAILKKAVDEKEEIQMAVAVLAKQSEDKYARLAYARRQDEIYFYNKAMDEKERYIVMVEEEKRRAEEEKRRAEEEKRRADAAECEVEKLRLQLAELKTARNK